MERSAAQVGRLAPYQATKCLSLHVIDQNLHVIDQNLHVHVLDVFRWPHWWPYHGVSFEIHSTLHSDIRLLDF